MVSMTTVITDGISIRYDDTGTGDALLLVHGHPFDRSMWRPQAEAFSAAGWRVIAPDLRGYGRSTVVPGKTELSTFARDLAALLDDLAIDRAVVGGLSMGGQIVLEFRRLFPERVRALILADTFAQGETEQGKQWRYDLADQLEAEGMDAYARRVLAKMIASRNVDALPDVAAHVLGMMAATPPRGAAAALRGRAERLDYTELLPTIDVPTLVVVGSEDEYTPICDAEYLRDRIPGCRLAVIEDAAHMPNLERPEQFNRVISDFLAGLR
jgi:pimeloyl-ACP methyl ester carboxylesterase